MNHNGEIMMKEGLNSYKKAYEMIEIGLQEKGEASSTELLSWLIERYNINSLNITSKGITYYLKKQNYKKYRRYETKPWIFKAEKD
jgi:hypothetical protein